MLQNMPVDDLPWPLMSLSHLGAYPFGSAASDLFAFSALAEAVGLKGAVAHLLLEEHRHEELDEAPVRRGGI